MSYRTALITGASSGIGRALALRLARDGAHVVLCARRTHEIDEAAREITANGGKARAITLDVTDTERTVATIRQADDELGGLDLIVANAGIGGPRSIAKMTWESIAPMLAVNFNGAIATLTAVLPRMMERRRGHLVGVSSIAALTGLPSGAPYCGSKGGLTTFLDSLRIDLAPSGVHVTAILPGAVKTPMSDKSKTPLPFLMPCEEAVDLIVRRLPSAPAYIEFPPQMSVPLNAIAKLPRPLRDVVLRRFPVPEVDES